MDAIKFKATVQNLSGDVWHFGFKIPDEYMPDILAIKDKRMICTLPNTSQYHCAAMPFGDGSYFIMINKERRTQLGLELGDELMVQLDEDLSKYGMEIPEEFSELIKMDPEGDRYFHSLSIGKQRSLLYVIAKPKTSDTRLKKALVIIDYLKETKGALDFKELNVAFKEANRRGY